MSLKAWTSAARCCPWAQPPPGSVTWTPESRSSDTIIDADATARRAVMLGNLVTIARFPGGVHDLTLSEPPVREQVFSALRRWMAAYVLR